MDIAIPNVSNNTKKKGEKIMIIPKGSNQGQKTDSALNQNREKTGSDLSKSAPVETFSKSPITKDEAKAIKMISRKAFKETFKNPGEELVGPITYSYEDFDGMSDVPYTSEDSKCVPPSHKAVASVLAFMGGSAGLIAGICTGAVLSAIPVVLITIGSTVGGGLLGWSAKAVPRGLKARKTARNQWIKYAADHSEAETMEKVKKEHPEIWYKIATKKG